MYTCRHTDILMYTYQHNRVFVLFKGVGFYRVCKGVYQGSGAFGLFLEVYRVLCKNRRGFGFSRASCCMLYIILSLTRFG